jgi:hypothetical protein
MTASGVNVASVEAEINYVRNPPPPDGPKLEFVTSNEEHNTMVTQPGRVVTITNARPITTHLDREGFVLVRHTSAVDDFHRVQQDAGVEQICLDETAALLEALTGASRVIAQSVKKRYGESATELLAPLPNAKPARYPHADNTDPSATELVELMDRFLPDLDLQAFSRYALYNVWRPFSPPPQDFPLAVCDGRTISPADEVVVVAVTEEVDAQGQLSHIVHDTTGYLYNPDHRWCYFPDMTIDEVIVFKSHDSDPTRTSRVPHSAFTDPTCPPGVPTRASVEVRALALFA